VSVAAGPWVLATRNRGKLRELRALFAEAGIAVIDLDEAGVAEQADEEQIERHDTFEANAVAKARYFAGRVGDLPVVADDSGLEVRALGGEPGVRSRRWSGRRDLAAAALDAANNEMLLHRLHGITDRRARFVCVAAWCGPGGEVCVERGEVEGRIAERASGNGGFGYDPYFYVDELGSTLGSASAAAKERVSHRVRAFRALLASLRAREGGG
jgi:XTP/dITP diphosphohydrolase